VNSGMMPTIWPKKRPWRSASAKNWLPMSSPAPKARCREEEEEEEESNLKKGFHLIMQQEQLLPASIASREAESAAPGSLPAVSLFSSFN
jgi:hypothetical protein